MIGHDSSMPLKMPYEERVWAE
ncbi:hypothetical protein STRTUCAR8_05276, partial [Streptomyces turgidiscabies Car8]